MFPVSVHGQNLETYKDIKAGTKPWSIPAEVPIAFVYNRRNYAVMMGTPDNLEDFAIGFSLTEEVVKSLDEIKSLDIHLSRKGVDLRFKVSEQALERLDITQRRRNMIGSASCGLCGLENADTLFKVLPRVSEDKVELTEKVIKRALAELDENQPLNIKTRSVHAAVWVSRDGAIQSLREDVGRHNALDKLLGVMAIEGIDVASGFVLMSSRCSYEIVEKAARRGVRAIVSVSGPTAFALEKAKEANMTIYARSGHSAVKINI